MMVMTFAYKYVVNLSSFDISLLNSRVKLQDIKELQKQRDKQNGVSAAALALGKKIPKIEAVASVCIMTFQELIEL